MSSASNATVKFDKNKPFVIMCEGIDEFFFLCRYLEFLEDRYADEFVDCHHVIDLGGIHDMSNQFKTIKSIPDYSSVKGILFVRDAEKSAKDAGLSLINNIEKIWNVRLDSDGLIKEGNDNKKIGFFLLPGKDSNGKFRDGTLEDLLVDLFKVPNSEFTKTSKLLVSVNDYISVLNNKLRESSLRTPHKNRLHLLLNSTDRYVGLKIGEACKKGAFDFDDPSLDDLKRLILEMQ